MKNVLYIFSKPKLLYGNFLFFFHCVFFQRTKKVRKGSHIRGWNRESVVILHLNDLNMINLYWFSVNGVMDSSLKFYNKLWISLKCMSHVMRFQKEVWLSKYSDVWSIFSHILHMILLHRVPSVSPASWHIRGLRAEPQIHPDRTWAHHHPHRRPTSLLSARFTPKFDQILRT